MTLHYYNECDAFAAEWLSNLCRAGLLPAGVVDDRRVEHVRSDLSGFTQCHFFAGVGGWARALELAGWPEDRPVWTGSCPCQPFSGTGSKKGFDDVRHLWPRWRALIEQYRPPTIFGEQVASPLGRDWLDLVSADLEALGYAVGAADLCAAGVGAPHQRQRLWFAAVRLGDADGARPQGGPGGAPRKGAVPPAPGAAGGVAHGDEPRREQLGQRDGDQRRPTRGFWERAEWLHCQDGRARPVEPGLEPLAHGLPNRVVCVCSVCETKTVIHEGVRYVWDVPRGYERLRAQEILFSEMYGTSVSTKTDNARSGALPSSRLVPSHEVLDVRLRGVSIASTPHERRRHGQSTRKHRDPVCGVSREKASNDSDDVNVRRLLEHIRGEGPPQTCKDLFCPVCERVGSHLCTETMGAPRAGVLRAYGNAIVPQVGALFIQAVMEATR